MSNASPSPTALPPHPVLEEYYRDARQKRPFLRKIFDETAGDYDRVERALALGSGRWYRRRALRRAGLTSGMRVLDVAMGTGLVSREASRIVGPTGFVLGLDPSAGMVAQARQSLAIPAVLGVGEALPVADASFDFLSMGYALRHLPDLRTTFAEFARALRPGGRACILEITRPASRVGSAALGVYFRGVLPVLARVVGSSSATRELWQYYWKTIDACVPPEQVMQAMRDSGFIDVRRKRELGIFSEYIATRA
jgi:demethylmenaquinone methyltransferase/2-methoxy-6-polyprenyl-1,4-benzoquinol methylase